MRLDVTSNHLELRLPDNNPYDEHSDELAKRVENFGLPVGKSASRHLNSDNVHTNPAWRRPERTAGTHSKDWEGSRD